MREQYQVMPPLMDEEYEALKADIAVRGVQVAIEIDEYGNTLDGHHRQRACREIGINDYPIVVRSGLSEAEKLTHARKANLLRRHLTQEQRRGLIADELRGDPRRSNRQIGAALGVDHKTVGAARERLGATGEIPQLDRTTGADGKARPAKQRRPRRVADLEECFGLPPGELAVKRAKMDHALGLIEVGVDPRSEKVTELLIEASVGVFKTPDYNPFHGRSEQEIRDWHLFVLFLVSALRWPVDHAAEHVEYLLQKSFQNVGAWLGEEGDKWRKACRMRAMSPQIGERWSAFVAEHEGQSAAEIEAILTQRAA